MHDGDADNRTKALRRTSFESVTWRATRDLNFWLLWLQKSVYISYTVRQGCHDLLSRQLTASQTMPPAFRAATRATLAGHHDERVYVALGMLVWQHVSTARDTAFVIGA